MTLTRANVELILVARTESWLTKASMATTVAGSNADLNDAIGYGVIQAGGTVGDRTSVADADIATVASADEDKMLDIAEYRLWQNIGGNLAVVDTKIGPRDEKLGQLQSTIDKIIARKKKMVEEVYSFGYPTLQAGVMILDFIEHDIDNVDSEGN